MKKRWLAVFLIIALVLSTMGITTYASSGPTVEIKADKIQIVKSDAEQEIEISVLLHNPDPEGSDIAGINFTLNSASDKLSLEKTPISKTESFSSVTYVSNAFTALNMNTSFEAYPLTEKEVCLVKVKAKIRKKCTSGKIQNLYNRDGNKQHHFG